VEANYEAHGYEPCGAGVFRFTPYHALPHTVVLVAKERERVVATMSLIMDNTILGLPSESIYPGEIEDLRHLGRRLGEVGNFADRELSRAEFLPIFVTLVKLASQHHVSRGGDTAIMTSTLRHGVFYRKVMGCAPLGPARAYPYVQHTVAQAYLLDIPMMKAKAPNLYQEVFGTPLPRQALLAPQIPGYLALYFASRSSQTDGRSVEEILQRVANRGNTRCW
jgi:hypothetical protein